MDEQRIAGKALTRLGFIYNDLSKLEAELRELGLSGSAGDAVKCDEILYSAQLALEEMLDLDH